MCIIEKKINEKAFHLPLTSKIVLKSVVLGSEIMHNSTTLHI